MPSTGISITNTFAAQTGNIPLSELDTNFSQLAGVVNSLNSFANYFVDSGSVNALTINIPASLTATLAAGLTFQVVVAVSNTGAATLTTSGSLISSAAITRIDKSALQAGDLLAGSIVTLMYDGTEYQLIQGRSGGFAVSYGTSGATVGYSVSSGTAYGAYFSAAGNGSVIGSTDVIFGQNGFGQGVINNRENTSLIISVNNTLAVTIAATGGVTIAPPSAGIALTAQLGSNNLSYGMAVTAASTYGAYFSAAGNGSVIGSTDFIFGQNGIGQAAIYNRENTSLIIGTNNTLAVTIAATGGVTIAPPSAGDTLTVAPSNTSGALIATSANLTNNAGASAGTLTNAPAVGNPTKWIKINDNGTIRSIPAW